MSRAFRILILCTGNSARSQIAEALVESLGRGVVEVASAGSHPAGAVNPLAVAVLQEAGIEWHGRVPRSVVGLEHERWDLVITVCDHARDVCPVFPHARVAVHWGMDDPAAVSGADEIKRAAFRYCYRVLERRVRSLMALPLGRMSDAAMATAVRAIAGSRDPDR